MANFQINGVKEESLPKLNQALDDLVEVFGARSRADLANTSLLDIFEEAAKKDSPTAIAGHVGSIQQAMKLIKAEVYAIAESYATIEASAKADAQATINRLSERNAQLERQLTGQEELHAKELAELAEKHETEVNGLNDLAARLTQKNEDLEKRNVDLEGQVERLQATADTLANQTELLEKVLAKMDAKERVPAPGAKQPAAKDPGDLGEPLPL
jgi:chromosome segregation ATPase